MKVGEQAGFVGPLIEGDVLIADEDRVVGNDDLVIAKLPGEHLVARTWRIGGRVRLLPLAGRESQFAREDMLLGVVIGQVRRYVI